MALPLFPIPFLEALLCFVPWKGVLRLVSLSKSETQMREWLINTTGCIRSLRCSRADLDAFLARYPNCGLATTLPSAEFPNIRTTGYDRVTDMLVTHSFPLTPQFRWPSRLQKLTLDYDLVVNKAFPESLTELTIYCCAGPLPDQPPRLKTLTLHCAGPSALEAVCLPPALTELRLYEPSQTVFRGLAHWPATLECIVVTSGSAVEPPRAWPAGLKRLRYIAPGALDFEGLDRLECLSIECLGAGEWWAGRWPPRLRHLHIGRMPGFSMMCEVMRVLRLPPNIECFILGDNEYSLRGELKRAARCDAIFCVAAGPGVPLPRGFE